LILIKLSFRSKYILAGKSTIFCCSFFNKHIPLNLKAKFMKKVIVILFFLWCGLYESGAYAACTRADFTGTWRFYAEMAESEARCTLVIPATGNSIGTTSNCFIVGVATRPLRGILSISLSCNVSGQITIGSDVRKIDAWISKGKDSISGMAWKPSNVSDGGFFAGVKQ
jgi:hypothetical protein